MKQRGFTLIELLAVIVILAIIALIATPIILGIINDSKEQSTKRSAELYIDAVEQAIVRKNQEGEYNPEKCKIEKGEVTCEGKFNPSFCEIKDGKLNCEGVPLEVEIDGEAPKEGTIVFLKGKVINGTELFFTGYKATINGEGKLVIYALDIQEEEGPEHLAQTNVISVTESKTGIVPTQDSNGNIVPGSEFKIKVSNNIKDENGNVVEYTFFVLSNSEDGKYVNLIAEQNITPDGKFTSEPQDADEWYVTSSNSNDNRYGPQTAYAYLSKATINWTNIPILESFNYLDEGNQSNSSYGYQNIVTSLDSSTGKYITTITPYSSSYGNAVTYENMRARLPYEIEVIKNTDCKTSTGSCPLWMVNYLSSSSYYSINDGKRNSTGTNYGYWLLSSYQGYSTISRMVSCYGRVNYYNTTGPDYGIRPVITILKSDLLRVMG